MIGVLDQFFDPLALSLVAGGTFVSSLLPATGRDAGRAFGALIPLLRARPARDAQIAHRAVCKIQSLSEYKGIVCADWVKTPVDFVHRAACRLADARGSETFAAWAQEELDDRRTRHAAAIGFWRHAAEVAPAPRVLVRRASPDAINGHHDAAGGAHAGDPRGEPGAGTSGPDGRRSRSIPPSGRPGSGRCRAAGRSPKGRGCDEPPPAPRYGRSRSGR